MKKFKKKECEIIESNTVYIRRGQAIKKLISFIVILIFVTIMACSETAEDKSATKKTKERITEEDEKSVVEKAEDKKDRNKTIEVKEWMARGYAAFKIKDYDEAIKYYKKALALNPNLAKAHYNLGTNYSNKGMLDEAISEFKHALTINPNYAEAHNNLGSIYKRKGMLDEAFSEYKKAVAISPDLPPANYNLGHYYFRKGSNSLAADYFHKAGLLFLKQGNREWALRAYKALKLTNSKELEQSLFEKLYPESKQKKSEKLRPNLILISIDTLRADHLGCYGYDRPTSPTLDKLASEGVLFEDASATSPWTLPSHGTLLTGFYPGQIGLNTRLSPLPSSLDNLATILSQHHITTAAITNSIFISQKYDFNRGFNYFRYVPESQKTTGAAPIIIEQAIQWVQQLKNQQFFLFLHFYDVHSDYRSLPQYEKQFVGPYYGVVDGTTDQLEKFRRGEIFLNKADVKHLIDLYNAGIRQLDDQLKVLFDYLRQEALLEKSFLIITSDHGEEFLDHGSVLHSRTQYQELINIPLIIHGPGIPRSKRLRKVVSLVDIMPTVLSLLDIPYSSTLAGLDLCPLWQKSRYELPDRFVFAEVDKGNEEIDIKRAVRHGRYKLHYNRLTKKSELFNLTNDPKEHLDISSEQPSVANLLFEELRKFMQTSIRGKQQIQLTPEEIEKLEKLGYL